MESKEVKEVKEVNDIKEMKKMKEVSIEDILSAARQLRDEENAQISAAELDLLLGPQPTDIPHASKRRTALTTRWWAAAACLLGFLTGFGVKSALPSGNSLAVVPSAKCTPSAVPSSGNLLSAVPAQSPDTILLREVVHDTIFQTRVIVRDAEPKAVVAQAEQTSGPAETPPTAGCSMLCDDIPYAYLAHN